MKLPVNYKDTPPAQRRLVREEYVRLQSGNCHHCQAPLSGPATKDILSKYIDAKLFPPNFFAWPVHLHHSHDSGLTIGAVHNACNAVLWQYHGE